MSLRWILDDLETVAKAMSEYQNATSPISQRDALLGANKPLETAGQFIINETLPFAPLLKLTLARWRELLADEGEQLAHSDNGGPVANPYVYGNPVQGTLFVGREDILHRLQELWGAAGQAPSVVLFGHRRMGKSSMLHALPT